MQLAGEFSKLLENMVDINPEMLKEMLNGVKAVRKDMVGIEDIQKAVEIINSPFPQYDKFTYFFPTENLRYIGKVVPEKRDSAFTITGSGNSILELANQGFKKIVTVDTNPFTKHILKLLMASTRCLSSQDYDKFLLNYEHNYFLSKDIFNAVINGFDGDEESINFWDIILMNDKKDLLTYFFKPISSDYLHIKYGLPFIKKYYNMRDRLEKADIEVCTGDALSYLKNHPDQEFDYIDITNILLYIYQIECDKDSDKFFKVLQCIQKIYNNNLKENGVFVFDYYFAANLDSILGTTSSDLVDVAKNAYSQSYNYFNDLYDLKIMSIEKIVNVQEKDNDTLIYTKKINK